MHRDEVARDFRGRAITPAAGVSGVEKIRFSPPVSNSGVAAIALAHQFGARRVVMVGYDCQTAGKLVHWHGDHPAGLGNAGSMSKWPAQFAKVALEVPGTEVLNASRATALTCFPRVVLEEALCA